MKAKRLFLFAAALFIVGAALLGAGWNGNASVSAGFPVRTTTIEFCGSAHGRLALGALVGLISSAFVFAVAMVRAIVEKAG